MRWLRFSIAGLMGIIVLVAIATAALRYASETVAAAVSLMTYIVLALAIVGAVCRRGAARAWWVGFASLGWMYLGLPLRMMHSSQILVSRVVLRLVALLMNIPVEDGGRFSSDAPTRWFFWIGHQFLALLAAVAGGWLAQTIFGAAETASLEAAVASQPRDRASAKRWILPAMIVLSVLAVTASVAIACARWEAAISAGLTYLLTWWLIGIFALGVVTGRGRSREFWLGATLLGAGFMFLVFNRPIAYDPDYPRVYLPTVEFLEALRPRYALLVEKLSNNPTNVVATTARITRALDQPVSIQLTDGTTLDDFIKYVRDATRRPKGEVIPIYVDPIGLQEAEKSMTSPLQGVQFEGVALRTSLRLCLRQLDLAYVVRDGLLLITSQENEEALVISPNDDPYQLVGHCLLAICAAVLGGLAARPVCDLARSGRPATN
jgi:hypothetical protein